MASDLTPIEDLDRNILNLCSRINAATYELLVLVREFDERVGWLKWGMQSCAEWLAWRCDLSMTTALEKVRAISSTSLIFNRQPIESTLIRIVLKPQII